MIKMSFANESATPLSSLIGRFCYGGGEQRLGAPAPSDGQGAALDESYGPTMDDGARDLGRGGGRHIFASPLSSHPK
jgi:hypothetical protein